MSQIDEVHRALEDAYISMKTQEPGSKFGPPQSWGLDTPGNDQRRLFFLEYELHPERFRRMEGSCRSGFSQELVSTRTSVLLSTKVLLRVAEFLVSICSSAI